VNESEVFKNSLRIATPTERAAYLDEACANQPLLRAGVAELLRLHAADSGFLEHPATSLGATEELPRAAGASGDQRAAHSLAEQPGTLIAGRYKLLEEIGEGGMGRVWMAQQTEPVKRLVAVKLIKSGMDTRQVVARFDVERQALALMDHPNIAKVFEAGATDAGRPFFVMELVKGVPITRYCDEHHLTPRERLELFIPVCHAVQHAHQKGIIHRDLKPSNVLIALYDDHPVPKVIDFGVAKATGQQLTAQTLHTSFGAVVGTFEYMSPEQASFNQLDVDTRSDIYSLGVVLYELLTGSTPFGRKELERVGIEEMLRVIREQEPSKPSTKLSTSAGLPRLAANRGTEPKRLTAVVRGELDWIVMKALEKDRGRRYETANGLAQDIKRHLHDEPVLACPPSYGYRLRKFSRRNRAAALTVAAVAAALLVGTTVATWQAVRASRAESRALAERDKKEYARADADAARRKAEEFAERLREATAEVAEADAHVRARNWAAAHASFAKAQGLAPDLIWIYVHRKQLYLRFGMWERAAEDDLKSVTLSKGRMGFSGDWYNHALLRLYMGDENGYRETCRQMLDLYGDAADSLAKLNLARTCCLARSPASDPTNLTRWAEHILSWERVHWHLYVAGLAHYRAGHYETAVARFRESLATGKNWNAAAINYPLLAMAYNRLGNDDEAIRTLGMAKAAIDGWADVMARGPPGLMPIPWFDWLECQSFYLEATLLLTGSPPPRNPILQTISDQGRAALAFADRTHVDDRAQTRLKLGEEELALRRANLGASHPNTLLSMWSVSESLLKLHRGDEAVQLIDECVQRAAGKVVDPRLLPGVLVLRLRHFERLKDAAGCRRTAEMYEELNRTDAVSVYDAACMRAVTAAAIKHDPKTTVADASRLANQEGERAVAWLKKAVAAGYNDAEHMRRDADLEAIREREDYKNLSSELRSKSIK
jgi:eukaryotic-like serine/threonine-protein kinase